MTNEGHDRFADALDNFAVGKHLQAPDALASFAQKIQGQESERLPDERRITIWRDLMMTHAHDNATTGGAGPLSQPALAAPAMSNPWDTRHFPPMQKRTRLSMLNHSFQVSVTALAVVAIVIAAFIAFPVIRGDRGPEITPTAFAAAPTASTSMLSMNATQTLPAISPSPATPIVTPKPSAAYREPQATDCKVEPLAVDEVMAILEGESSGRGVAKNERPANLIMDEETYNALAEVQREWLACRIHGSPFQNWALESDDMIRSDFQEMYFPHYNMEMIRQDLVQMRSELFDADANTGLSWDPPEGTYLPMVPKYDSAAIPMTGRTELLIVWRNSEGDVITAPTTGEGAPVRSLESELPNLWSFVWDEGSGTWLIGGYSILWGQTFGP